MDDPEKAARTLKDNGFFAKLVEVLAIEVEDKPGELSKILRKASEVGLNVEYMYAMTRPVNDKPVMVMSFKDIDAAERIFG